MSRGGKKLRRRKQHAITSGKTGSHRNGGKGFHHVPIADREQAWEKNPRNKDFKPAAPVTPLSAVAAAIAEQLSKLPEPPPPRNGKVTTIG